MEIGARESRFKAAKAGMIGLETLFAVVWKVASEKYSIDQLIEKLSVAPRNIFGLPVPVIKEGETANLTLFDPNAEYTFTESGIQSKSKNSAFIGKQLKGKVIGIINKEYVVINK